MQYESEPDRLVVSLVQEPIERLMFELIGSPTLTRGRSVVYRSGRSRWRGFEMPHVCSQILDAITQTFRKKTGALNQPFDSDSTLGRKCAAVRLAVKTECRFVWNEYPVTLFYWISLSFFDTALNLMRFLRNPDMQRSPRTEVRLRWDLARVEVREPRGAPLWDESWHGWESESRGGLLVSLS